METSTPKSVALVVKITKRKHITDKQLVLTWGNRSQ